MDSSAGGYRRLALAVINASIDDLLQNSRATSRRKQTRYREAYDFFWGETDWHYSAENLCHALGIDLRYLRRGLLRHLEQGKWSRLRLSVSTHNRETIVESED